MNKQKEPEMKRTLRRSVYGNIVGYEGRERVTTFVDNRDAREWLEEVMTTEEADKQINKVGNY